MYDAKKESKDENLKYNTIADRGYFNRISYDSVGSIPTSYVPIESALKR
ncbi:hypothetical protein SAMN02745134_00200 [Clostridium acidisoli DSM 12555]|jgi:hypothetical protein|uniref:Uncharacterized protein n=1 Tax=Clostridium acidisoli DSM 12555 TaxID=1121291 RepID=A0A1W1WZN2_9CLOT|nr:hypothetical protein [Clostridium acidisoli]SMC16990.1 hypothetical protein SAMN02745134_00200 [Clostridium acidisoli DSM 12555]